MTAQRAAVSITLPLPPRALHAHAKGHWRAKAGPTKAYREEACLLARIGRTKRFKRARLSLDFYWPDRRRRDTLNAVHGIKPAIDGLVDAGVIEDDSWACLEIGHIRCRVDRENPGVVLTVEEL